jgi:hypothetical protein
VSLISKQNSANRLRLTSSLVHESSPVRGQRIESHYFGTLHSAAMHFFGFSFYFNCFIFVISGVKKSPMFLHAHYSSATKSAPLLAIVNQNTSDGSIEINTPPVNSS